MTPTLAGERAPRRWLRATTLWLRDDWRGEQAAIWGAALLALTSATVAMYYAATPAIVRDPDTPIYLRMAQAITTGKLVDTTRLPGYPLFIDLVYLIAGKGNLVAVGAAQGAAFVAAILVTYTLGLLIFRRSWMAFIPDALVGTNTHVISFIKPILTEGLTILWVTLLALALTYYALRPSSRRLWLTAGALVVTFMTRPEWVYFPVPMLLFMLLLAWRAGALVAIYSVALAYMAGNALINGYFGFSDVTGVNLLGRVMQYHLTGDAPPQYAGIDRLVSSWVARGSDNPLSPIRQDPAFAANHYQLASQYVTAMVLSHPFGFVTGVWSSMLGSLASSLPFHPLPALSGPLTLLGPLDAFSRWTLSNMLILLPIVAIWWTLLLWPRAPRTPVIAIISGLSLMVIYDLAMTTAGSYWYYPRMHTPFDPLLFLLVAGSLLLAGVALAGRIRARLAVRVGGVA